MPYSQVILLANKFAEKQEVEASGEVSKFFGEFQRKYRAILNEMEGDYMTLRIKGMDRGTLQELGGLYHNLLEIFKTIDDSDPFTSIDRFSRFMVNKNTKITINKLESIIHHFLKQNEVALEPGTGFSQARVDSLKLVSELALAGHKFLETSPKSHAVKLQHESKEEYQPFSGPADKTRI